MKKKLLFLLFILFIPFIVHAEVDYDITDYYISSEVEIAGSIKVKELIVLDGEFNGYERNLVYKNSDLEKWEAGNINFEKSSIYAGSGIEKLKVATFKVNSKVDFDTLENIKDYAKEATSATLGDKNVYTVVDSTDGKDVRMYMPSHSGKVAFYLEYVVTNAVVIHKDVAELYFPYVGDKFSDPINNVKLRVFIPSPDNSDHFRIWAHGPLNGSLNMYENDDKEKIGLIATTTNLPANTGFDIRMTFDKSIISIQDFLNHSDEVAFDKILKVEKARANDANKKRNKIKFIYNTIKYSSIAYLVILVILWIYIYFKYDKEYKSDFKSKYYREFIEDYDVEVIDYLFKKKISPNAMSASIMNLIYKKNLKVEEIEGKGKKKEYKFTLLNRDKISKSEDYLIDFLFDTVGNSKEFTTKELKDYASSSSYTTFNTKYSTWKNKVTNEGIKQNFYESNTKIKFIGFLYCVVGAIIFFINQKLNTDLVLPVVLIIPAVIFLSYTIGFNKRSKKGSDDYVKWKAFKNFLNDFGTFDQRELPEVALWERYMVYAVIFGIADKVQKAMNVKIKELDPNNTIYSPYYNTWLFYNMNNSITHSINTAVVSSINSAVAKSASSSGSGYGGGFSSGSGGGFGGGGGGHGF